MLKLIVGLGNPGFRYRTTRHNIGYMVLDRVAREYKIRLKKRFYNNSICGRGKIGDIDVFLAKPLTFMNLSGKAVSEIKNSEGISLSDLLIIMDDIDLPFGKIRIKASGSSGGHRGLYSVIKELKTEDFSRLRIGIGPKQDNDDLIRYVLSPFNRQEKSVLSGLLEKSVLCVSIWVTEGIKASMNRFNSS